MFTHAEVTGLLIENKLSQVVTERCLNALTLDTWLLEIFVYTCLVTEDATKGLYLLLLLQVY